MNIAYGLLALAVLMVGGLDLRVSWAKQDLESEIVAIEKSLWEGWKNEDAKPCEEHCTEDMIVVGQDGISIGKEEVLQGMSGGWSCEVESYSFSELKVNRFGSDTIIVSYKAYQDAVCEGAKMPPEVYVSTVYVKEGDKWKWASFHETPAAKSDGN